MAEIEWETLAEVVRARVDELVLADQRFRAVHELVRNDGGERVQVGTAQRLVWARQKVLADRIQRRPAPPRDLATLTAAISALPRTPDAIEALWDGDSTGWMVRPEAVTADPRTEKCLTIIRHGGDIRLFNGRVPPWPEAHEAAELGTALAKTFGVPFYFPYPDAPELPDIRWWDTV